MAATQHTLEGEAARGAMWVGITLGVTLGGGAVVFGVTVVVVKVGGWAVAVLRRMNASVSVGV